MNFQEKYLKYKNKFRLYQIGSASSAAAGGGAEKHITIICICHGTYDVSKIDPTCISDEDRSDAIYEHPEQYVIEIPSNMSLYFHGKFGEYCNDIFKNFQKTIDSLCNWDPKSPREVFASTMEGGAKEQQEEDEMNHITEPHHGIDPDFFEEGSEFPRMNLQWDNDPQSILFDCTNKKILIDHTPITNMNIDEVLNILSTQYTGYRITMHLACCADDVPEYVDDYLAREV